MAYLMPQQQQRALEEARKKGQQQTVELAKNRKAFFPNGDVANTMLADKSPFDAQPVWYQQGFKTQDDYRNYLQEQRELADKRATPWYGQGFASETDWHNYMREQRFLETMAKKRPQGALDGLTQVVASRRPAYPRRPAWPAAAKSVNYGSR